MTTATADDRATAATDGSISESPSPVGTTPASLAQVRLWFLEHLGLAGVYNVPFVYVVEGELDVAALERSFTQLVQRHDALRTCFLDRGGEVFQCIKSEASIPLRVVDVRNATEPRAAEIEVLQLAEATAPFDLATGPLLRLLLLRTAESRWILNITLHHIICDGWSVAVLMRELSHLYAGWRSGQPTLLPSLPTTFAEHTLRQRARLSNGGLRQSLRYWCANLSGASHSHSLPLDRPRPVRRTFSGAVCQFELSSELSRALVELSRAENATLFAVLLTAFQVLLARWNGQDDCIVGTVSAGRRRPELQGLVGFFLNTLPIRTSLAGNPSFREVLQRTKQAVIEAYAHEDAPLEQILAELAVQRDAACHPLFQTAFVLDNFPNRPLQLAGVAVQIRPNRFASTHLDLSMHIRQTDLGLRVRIAYATELFDAPTIERLMAHFESLLALFAADPACLVRTASLLTAREQRQLIDWNATAAPYAEDACIDQLLVQQARRTPHAVALIDEHRSLTYAQLDRRSNQLARHLRAQQVGPEVVVGLCAERSIEMVVAILAILKAGGAYLPLDPHLPVERLRFMIEDAGIQVVVGQTATLRRLPPVCTPVDLQQAGCWSESAARLEHWASPGNLAYVIYTSGSTGTPKAAMNEHRPLVNRLTWMQAAFPLDASDRVLQKTPFTFDVSVWEFLWPLLQGAALVIARPDAHGDPDYLGAAIRTHEITTIHFVPSMLQAFVDSGALQGCASLRRVIVSGEALSGPLAERFRVLCAAELHNLYGPTEAAIDVSSQAVSCRWGGSVPIGRPIANVRLYVLDAALEPVPVGVSGELYIAGIAVGRGYLRRPALTAQRFMADPCGAAGARMYRTGDLVRYRVDGTLEFLGRIDHQIKLRGLRIELGEIEAAALSQPYVQHAAAVVARDARGERLVAHVVVDWQRFNADRSARPASDELVQQWQRIYEDLYASAEPGAAPSLAGWNSSYSGEPIPAGEMREWVDSTVARILVLRPRRVLEIGCGTGLLLEKIAPHCESYCGTDVSGTAIAKLAHWVRQSADWQHVHLHQCAATEIEGVAPATVDTVILNSVVQCFPDVDYLLTVLERVSRLLVPNGRIFIGDVRHLGLLRAFHCGVRLARARPTDGIGELQGQLARALAHEKELVIDPQFFAALTQRLPHIALAAVMLKRGRAANELTRYRFDVVLQLGTPRMVVADQELAWGTQLQSLTQLAACIRDARHRALRVTGVPNRRVAGDVAALQLLQQGAPPDSTVASLVAASAAMDAQDPEDFWELGEEHGYSVEVSWSEGASDGRFDVLFTDPQRAATVEMPQSTIKRRPLHSYASNPQQQAREHLLTTLMQHLEQLLPRYMLPSAILLHEQLPLISSGKVDRRALERLSVERQPVPGHVAAATPTENALAKIWCEVLRLESVSATDDFFELGGHSLLATQVIARIRRVLGAELPLRVMFDRPCTIQALRARIEALDPSASAQAAGIVARPRGGPVPLSFAQQRLWAEEQMSPGSGAYNIMLGWRLSGQLSVAALQCAIAELLRRHESLRTRIETSADGELLQVIDAPPQLPLENFPGLLEDLSILPPDERERGLQRSLVAFEQRGFVLCDTLFRVQLVRLTREEHVLLLAMHHIIVDQWSLGVMIRELALLYAAFEQGQSSPLPEPRLQYADYAVWQRERLQGQLLETQLEYWRKRLAGLSTQTKLPTDRPRPPVQSHRGAQVSFVLPPTLVHALHELGRQRQATRYMVLLAAFKVVLARWSGQKDIVVGSPVAGRIQQETESLVGMFVNALVLRTQLQGAPSFTELLDQVRETLLEAYAHQELPFDRLVQKVLAARDLSHNALFQVMFVAQNASTESLQLPGLRSRLLPMSAATARFDLTIRFYEGAEGLTCRAEYAADLFDAATIEALVGSYRTLLEDVARDPHQCIWELQVLSNTERQRVLGAWNQTQADYPRQQCLHQLFEAQAARTPDAVALYCGEHQLTYRQLNQRANQTARYLIGLGVGPDVLVGLCVERSLHMMVGLLGVLKAGGAYCPIDPNNPDARIDYLLRDAATRIVLTQRSLMPRLAKLGEPATLRALEEADFSAYDSCDPHTSVGPQHLAYVIYTSGSTGKPKGAMICHDGLVNYVTDIARRFEVDQGNGAPINTPLAFDATITSLLPPLISGGALTLLAEGQEELPQLGAALAARRQYAVVKLTPAHLEALQELCPEAACDGATRTIAIGGAALTARHVEAWRKGAPGTRIVNHYGPTETVVGRATYRVTEETPHVGRIPIGRPISNTQLYVVDEYLEPLAVGAIGELCIAGDGLARGYLRRAGLTAEKFVANPFGAPGSRMYRTGDRVRYLRDGNVDYIGRVDRQVKIRGYRIELGEIEAALLSHAAVRQALVLLREDQAGERRLVAYVVPHAEQALDAAALRQHLLQQQPEFMIPAAFVLLQQLPLTINGKVDHKALPAPEEGGRQLATRLAPRTASERVLAEIWQAVLKLERVGVDDNFFELGGDSIKFIQIIARAKRAGLRLTLRQFFEHPTVAGLARVATVTQAPVRELLVEGECPLTPVQRTFFEQRPPQPQHHNQSVLLECCQPLAQQQLATALAHLTEHHDALRLRYRCVDGAWQQYYSKNGPAGVELIDLATLDAVGQDAAIREHAQRMHEGLDLEHGPLLRAALFALGAHRSQQLLLVAHHLIVDGVSWRILLEDLRTACQQLGSGSTVTLPAKTASYRGWAEHLIQHSRSEALAAARHFWTALPGGHSSALPMDRPLGTNRMGDTHTVMVWLDAQDTRALLQEVPARHFTQVNDALLTVIVAALNRWTGRHEQLIELEGHGREPFSEELEISRTVGWFTTLFPVLLDLRAAATPSQALRHVKEQLRAVPHRGISYGMLRYLGGVDAFADAAQPAVTFNYLGHLHEAVAEGGYFAVVALQTGQARSPQNPRRQLLEITSAVVNGRLGIYFTYSSAIHDEHTIRSLAQDCVATLQGLIADCLVEAGRHTPADFPLVQLEQRTLDELHDMAGERGITDIYPMSSLQQGLLFHSLASPASIYLTTLSWNLRGALNPAALEAAWQDAVRRHAILRTAFVLHETGPLQVVLGQGQCQFEYLDCSADLDAACSQRIESLVQAHRAHGFQPDTPPLMRVTLVRTPGDVHRLIWTHHHLIMDGWSLPILLQEIFAGYARLLRGESLPRQAAEFEYRDYIAWLGRQDLARSERYWREQLRGFGSATELGIEREAAGEALAPPRHARHRQLLAISGRALEAFAREHKVTVNTLVQGAWALLLSRYGSTNDVAFGVVVSGRPAELTGSEHGVGPFINTLPLRVAIRPQHQVIPWLLELQVRQSQLVEHQHCPLSEVQRWSELAPGVPLFKSIYVFENYPKDVRSSAGAQLVFDDMQGLDTPHYPLSIEVFPGEAVTVDLIYDASRFESTAVARLADHFEQLLSNLLARPAAALQEVQFLSERERQQLLIDWNGASSPRASRCCHELFEACARAYPDATAVIDGQHRLTYRELSTRSDHLATYLQQIGVGPEVVVGVCMERCAHFIIGLLAIWKAGGTYLPLDPVHPPARLQAMLEDAATQVLLVQPQLDMAASFAGTVLQWDATSEERLLADYPKTPAPSAVRPEHLAYVIFTSGSTGRCKGVAATHASIHFRLTAQEDIAPLRPGEVSCQKTSISFVDSIFEILGPLLSGGSLVIASTEVASSPDALLELIEREHVSRLVTVPSLAQTLLQTDRVEARLQGLRCWTLSGERLSAPLLQGLHRRLPQCAFFNLYGCSEIAGDATFYCNEQPAAANVPIGRPLTDAQVYVLSCDLEPVPIGVAGELYVAGAGVARGYVGRSGLTAERFLANPFGAPGSRMYRTGDRVRYMPDGNLQFIGRADHQIKLRGVRVEPAEIEAVLLGCQGVRHAVVILADGESATRARLVAYLVAQPEAAPPTSTQLREQLHLRLPAALVPDAFVWLQELPLNVSGKLDRERLPQPQRATSVRYQQAVTATECMLVQIWSEVLKCDRIGIQDSFFELGGNSLLLMHVLSALNRRTGRLHKLIDLLKYPTIHLLGTYLDSGHGLRADLQDIQQRMARRRARRGQPTNRGGALGSEVPHE